MACPPGYRSDNLVRVPMPLGPFNEPRGTDCYLYEPVYLALMALTIVTSVGFLTLYLSEIFKSPTATHKVKRDLKVIYAFISLSEISKIILVVCGYYLPSVCLLL